MKSLLDWRRYCHRRKTGHFRPDIRLVPCPQVCCCSFICRYVWDSMPEHCSLYRMVENVFGSTFSDRYFGRCLHWRILCDDGRVHYTDAVGSRLRELRELTRIIKIFAKNVTFLCKQDSVWNSACFFCGNVL